METSRHYADIYEFLKHGSVIGPDDSIVECGGHTGTDTKKICKLFPDNRVHCIEANKTLYDNLQILRSEFPNLSLYNLGLSSKNETLQFFIDTDPKGDAGASSFLKANERDGLSHLSKIERPVNVECVTLQMFMNNTAIKNIYLLWLDVEQHEYEILNACSREVLSKIKYVYTEVNFRELRKGGKLYEDVLKLMNKHNFQEIMKTPQGSNNYDWQANVLFENKMYGKVPQLKILHISHHVGCMRDHAYIYEKLGFQYEFWKFTKGLFNITSTVANAIWQEKKDYFNSFDYIVTSDTAPISRIFMENISELKPTVIVWICNRFDYNMESDRSYYEKFNQIAKFHADKFKIVPYSDFEGIWCKDRGIADILPTITPIGINDDALDCRIDGLQVLKDSYVHDSNSKDMYSDPTELVEKVFIPIYQNDCLFYKLNDIFTENGIPCFNGGYKKTSELKHCKAMVTFPDAFSKLITFETIQNEVVVFLPSKEFLIRLHPTTNNGRAYWFNCPFGHLNAETVKFCEWYRYVNCRIYFDSIEDLVMKIKTLTPDIVEEKRKWCRIYGKEIETQNIEKWADLFA
jgi:FkbM family methyltransferase